MNVIPPLTITDTLLTSSTIAEPDTGEVVYSAGTTYGLGAVVISTTTHLKYTSLQAGNVGHPLSVAIEQGAVPTATDWWVMSGPTNRWAMFDQLRNTASVAPLTLTVVVTPGVRVDALGLHGLVADSVNVSMTSGGVGVYSHTQSLGTIDSLALFDLPPYTNGIVTLVLTAASGNVECGAFDIGMYQYIGEVEYNAESDVVNYSTITRNVDGGLSVLTPRPNVPKIIAQLVIDKSYLNVVRILREALAGVPATWAGVTDNSDGFCETLLIHGKYNVFTLTMDMPMQATISLEVEEI